MIDKNKINPRELRVFNNKNYAFFVCDILNGFKILSGWEYKEDALDHQKELIQDFENGFKWSKDSFKVYTRRHLNTLIKGCK